MKRRDFLSLVLVCLAWGASVVVGKIAVSTLGIPPLYFAFLRMALVTVVLAPKLWPLPPRLGQVLLATSLIGGISFALLFIGLQDATASAAGVVTLLSAPLTVLFAIVLLGEKVGWRRAAGIALTLAGVLTVVADPAGMKATLGLAFIAGNAAAGALGVVLLKRLDMQPIALQAWAGAGGMVLLLPLTLLLEQGQWRATLAGGWGLAGCLAFSGLVVSVAAHTKYYALIQRYDANMMAPLTLMTPVFTLILGMVFNDESLTSALLVGGGLTMAGVLIIVMRPIRTIPKWMLLRNPAD